MLLQRGGLPVHTDTRTSFCHLWSLVVEKAASPLVNAASSFLAHFRCLRECRIAWLRRMYGGVFLERTLSCPVADIVRCWGSSLVYYLHIEPSLIYPYVFCGPPSMASPLAWIARSKSVHSIRVSDVLSTCDCTHIPG